jgi:RHS repeat-associated protein
MPTVTTTYVIGNGNNGAGANQIASETTSGVTTAYAYDGNGNRTSRTISGTTDVFSYDYENRLTSLDYLTGSSGTGMYTYTYDYRTRRVSRTEPSAGTTYIVFDGGTSIEEYTSTPSTPTVEYVRGYNYGGGVGGLEYSIRSGVPSFNFYDSRGDVTTKTSAAGAVTWETAYEAFGNETVSSGTTPADRQRASTKEQDPTGFLNEGFRYRDLSTGTFLTRDPIGFKAGLNNYTYVHQNPWTRFDPEGLDATNANNNSPTAQPSGDNKPATTSTAPTSSQPQPSPGSASSAKKTNDDNKKQVGGSNAPPSKPNSEHTTEVTITEGPGGVAGFGALGLGGFVSGSIQFGVIINTTNPLDSRFTLQVQGNVMTGMGIALTGGTSQGLTLSGEKSKSGFSGEGAIHGEGGIQWPGVPVTAGAAVDVPFKTIGAVMTGKRLSESSGSLSGDFKAKGTAREGVGAAAFGGVGVGYTESLNSPTLGQMARFLGGLF